MDDLPVLVVVTGPPAGGKSTVADAVARELGLPLVTKDGIKETLFDTLGTGDRDWSRRLGEATWRVLFHVLDATLAGGASVVAEGNFEPSHANRRFAVLPPCRAVQVYCDAPDEELVERYRERAEGGERHPGHLDDEIAEDELEEDLENDRWRPLELGGPLVLYGVDDRPDDVVERLRAALSR